LSLQRKKKYAQLISYNDSDLAGDIDTRKSMMGVVFYLGNNVITWPKVGALSSCEAEYIAGTMAAYQVMWLARLLAEVKGEKEGVFQLNIGNESAIQLSKNHVFHDHVAPSI
jgi:hypothetical protein